MTKSHSGDILTCNKRRKKKKHIYFQGAGLYHLEEVSGKCLSHARDLQAAKAFGKRWLSIPLANHSVVKMKYQKLLVILSLKIIFFFSDINLTSSQRTISRQGTGKEPPIVKIPDQGILLGREVNKKKEIKLSTI